MNKSTEKKTVLDHIDYSDYPKELKIEPHNDIDYRESLLLGISIVFLLVIVPILLFLLRYSFIYPILYNLVFFFCIFIILFVLIFVVIPEILIFTIIVLRTKSTVFIREFFIVFQFPLLLFFSLLAGFHFPESYSIVQAFLLLGIISLWFFIFFQQYSLKRKPLIQNVKMNISQAPIVSVHSIEIKEELDGYSQRPISSDFQLLEKLISSSSSFVEEIEKFSIFLGKKGELIDWHIEESFAILYPRFIVKTPNLFKNPLFYYQLLRRVRLNEELTSIEITLSPPQISININFQDYETLNRDTTFHILCFNILKSMKQSLTAFLNNDLEVAHNELTRGRDIEKPFIQNIVVFNLFSSSYAFLAKIYTTVLKRKKKEI